MARVLSDSEITELQDELDKIIVSTAGIYALGSPKATKNVDGVLNAVINIKKILEVTGK